LWNAASGDISSALEQLDLSVDTQRCGINRSQLGMAGLEPASPPWFLLLLCQHRSGNVEELCSLLRISNLFSEIVALGKA